MRAELPELQGIGESRRRLRGPLLDCLRRWQAVEGVVDLDGLEAGGVVLEPSALRQVLRIHDPAPVAVHPSRATDVGAARHHEVRAARRRAPAGTAPPATAGGQRAGTTAATPGDASTIGSVTSGGP